MPAKLTIERIMRDDNDDSGQTIRDWKIEADPTGGVVIRLKHGDGFILMRPTDIDVFTSDLKLARDAARTLAETR